VPNILGCHTQAKSLDELMERIKEAIELCLEYEITTTIPTASKPRNY
jgi:predicted RNase H-like HicB family nuclease